VVAAVLTLGAISLIVYAATRRDGAAAPDMANAGNAVVATPGASIPAPDISNMTPREQFDRLYDRVMTSAQGSDTAAVIRFWPMASGAYAQLPEDVRDIDARFHMADLHLLVGQFPPAVALADTILAESSNNLLAHYVKALAAEFQGDSVGARAAQSAFLGSFAREIERPVAEYTHHRAMLDQYRQTIVRQ
jgi:predicted Zn-dependent protease with MMP-like domain